MFIQGPRLVIWDLLVTLFSGQEPGPALAIYVGESPASPSFASAGEQTQSSPQQRPPGASSKSAGAEGAVFAGAGTAPAAVPTGMCLEGGKAESQTLGRESQFSCRTGSMLTSSNSTPRSVFFHQKHPKRLLMEGNSVPTTL